MNVLVIPCGASSKYLFELAFRERFKPDFISRFKVEGELRKRSDYNLIVLDSRFQDLYGVHILENLERKLPHIPKLVIAECGELRKKLRAVSLNKHNYIINPPRIRYLRDLSCSIIEKKLHKLDVNDVSQIINLADAIDDIEKITRSPKDHFVRVKELADEIYTSFKNDLSIEKGILTNFAYLHDVNRTRVKNRILQDLESEGRITEKDYLNVFCGVGKLDEIVNVIPGWGHFYLETYEKSQKRVGLKDIVAVADAYDIYERKLVEEGSLNERPVIVNELRQIERLNPIVLDRFSEAA